MSKKLIIVLIYNRHEISILSFPKAEKTLFLNLNGLLCRTKRRI
jgi:hypothetical protein